MSGFSLRSGILSGILVVSLVVLSSVAWFASRFVPLGEIPFGYYRDYCVAKQAIKATECVDSMAYARNEDMTLESFHFKVHLKSGYVVRLWLDAHQDIDRVITAPKGLLIVNPRYFYVYDQVYPLDSILDSLSVKRAEDVGLRDILSNVNKLVPLFDANYDGDAIQRVTWKQGSSSEFRSYLRLEIVDETVSKGWSEIPTN